MTKIIAFSDTHGNKSAITQIEKELKKCDYVFFCGDGIYDLSGLPDKVKEKLIAVRGNCDFFSSEKTSAVKRIESVNFFITHGHNHGVKGNIAELCNHTKSIGANVAVFGHTHLPLIAREGGVMLINPGSLAYPRSGLACYAEITVDGFTVSAKIVYPNTKE